MNVLDHVHPEDLAHVLEETEKALAEGGVATNEAEYRFRHRDGSWRWMESVGTYLLDDPAVGGVVVTSRDVTRRKEAEERLRRPSGASPPCSPTPRPWSIVASTSPTGRRST
jgi:PAS domain S-box-containing protein